MTQESPTFKRDFYLMFGPLLVAAVGWFMSSTLTEIKQDVKLLLEANATLKEKVHQLETKLETLDRDTKKANPPLSNLILFDKTKKLVLTKRGFCYV